MERLLVKTGIYSFVVSFFLLIIFWKREKETVDVEGFYTFEVTSYPDYFFTIFRYSTIASVIAVVLVAGYMISERPKSKQ